MLVAVVFSEGLVIVAGIASVSGLLLAVSWAVAVLVPIRLFHIYAVLSLFFLFFSFSLSRSLASDLIVLLLFRCHAYSLSIAGLCCLFLS